MLTATTSLLACGGDSRGDDDDGTGLGDGDGDGDGAGDGDGDGDGDGTGDGDGDGDGDGGPRWDVFGSGDDGDDDEDGCTPDMQSVTGPGGEILYDCEPDEGCYQGECIPACEAAALNKGSIGCEYYIPTPPFYANDLGDTTFDGSCHAVMMANTWGHPVQFSLSFLGQDYDVMQYAKIPQGIGAGVVYEDLPADGIPEGQVAILFVSHQPDAANGNPLTCPIPPAYIGNAAAVGTGMSEAFELISDIPITAYDIIPYGGANTYLPSASLLQPRTAWGDNYVLPTPHYPSGKLWALAVAREDDTVVTISTNASVIPGGIAVPPPGVATDYALMAGEFVQWTATSEMAGTVIAASKPVGVYTGNQYLYVPTLDAPGGGGQDSSHQQVPHVQALGSTYVGLGIPTRLASLQNESVLYRMVGVVDGTTLSYDPAAPPGAPAALQLGQAVEFETRDLFSVSSQDTDHPFAFTQYMSGSIADSLGGCVGMPVCALGDEEWIQLVPPAQYLSRYAFFVDPTYGVTGLSMVRTNDGSGFADVQIECYGVVDTWQPIGAAGDFEVAHLDLYRNGAGACAASQQLAWSDEPFGVVVWGTDWYSSYGYPAGGNAQSINDVVVPAG